MIKKTLAMIAIILIVIIIILVASNRGANDSISQQSEGDNISGPSNMTEDDTENNNLESSVEENKFSLDQVATHSTEGDCFSVINGIVYDLTAWINKHPGGDKNILKICGIDGSDAFNRQHGNNDNAKKTLEGFEIGVIAE